VGGLATFAVMCNSYNWLCSSRARRTEANGFLGDEAAPPFVVTGNAAAKATAFLARVAVLRGVQVLVENPPRSLIWSMFSHHKVLLDLPYSCTTVRCGFRPSGSTEDEIIKEYRFACTHPWVVSLSRTCVCPPSVAHVRMTRRLGSKSWGRPTVMKRSQEYPALLGTAVVAAWVSSSAPLPGCSACGPVQPSAMRTGSPVCSALMARAAPFRPGSSGRISRPKASPKSRSHMGRPRASHRSRRTALQKQHLKKGGRSSSSEAVLLCHSESESDLFAGARPKASPKSRSHMGRPRASPRSRRTALQKQHLKKGGRSSSSEAVLLCHSESESDLFAGASVPARLSDGLMRGSAGDDSEPDLFAA